MTQTQIVGDGPAAVFVISQALPIWPQTELFKHAFAGLKKHCTFHIHDALFSIDDKTQLNHFIERWKTTIMQSKMKIFLGFSLGGVILQHLLSEIELQNCYFITISAPAYIHNDMLRKIKNVMILLENNEVDLALENLAMFVRTRYDEEIMYPVSSDQRLTIKRRLLNGFRVMLEHDARHKLQQFNGKLLSMIGSESRLVHISSVHTSPSGQLKIISGAGMHVLAEQNMLCSQYILKFLGIANNGNVQ